MLSPLHHNGTVDTTPQLDGLPAPNPHHTNADLFGAASSSWAEAHREDGLHSELWQRRGKQAKQAEGEGEGLSVLVANAGGVYDSRYEDGGGKNVEEGGSSRPGSTRADSNGHGSGSGEDRVGGWSKQTRTVRREESIKSNESFKSAPGSHGIAGSSDEAGMWSDGGDRHGPLRNMANANDRKGSHARADLFGQHAHPAPHLDARRPPPLHTYGMDPVDDASACSSNSNSVSSSASATGSSASSQSSWASSVGVASSISGSGWGRRLRLWKRGGVGVGGVESCVLSLQHMHNLTIHCKGSAARHAGGGQQGMEGGGQHGAIWVIRASPDAELVATGGQEGVVWVWQVTRDNEPTHALLALSPVAVATFRGHSGAVLDVAWSRDLLLVSASVDLTVRVWHTSSPTALRILTHSDMVTSVLFHPINQQLVFTACLDGQVRLFDLRPDNGASGAHTSSVDTMGIVTALALSGVYERERASE